MEEYGSKRSSRRRRRSRDRKSSKYRKRSLSSSSSSAESLTSRKRPKPSKPVVQEQIKEEVKEQIKEEIKEEAKEPIKEEVKEETKEDEIKMELDAKELDKYQEFWEERQAGDVSYEHVGPVPLNIANNELKYGKGYGGALRPGEGSAIAAFVQSGKRIPRRGEIGLTSEEIQGFEESGYVMSGSRHHRMNAVRIRKENQVISAEEKRALLLLSREEKAKKENKIIADFRELIGEKLKGKSLE